jgi:dTDP-4-amino-4,6-dideoxygalactose transaminase
MDEYLVAAQSSTCSQEMHLQGAGAVAELEGKLARHYGMRHAVCVSNATTGLLAIALALDLEDCEFVCSPYTYGASVGTWLLRDNQPRFADIDPQTLTLDLESARRAITPKTRAILSTDIYGHPSDSRSLRALADEFGLWFVADAAQSFGASREGLPASSCADALVVSFTAGKVLFAGEGGAILTNDSDLFEKVVWFTQHPYRQKRELGLHLWNEFGLNARIHPVAAVWANAAFDETLAALRTHQGRCFQVIRALNSIGLTDPIRFEEEGISPSFSRFTAAWRSHPRPSDLQAELARRGCSLSVEPAPVSLLYKQAAFLAQFEGRYRIPVRCRHAERQARVRFCLEEANGIGDHANSQFLPPPNRGRSQGLFRARQTASGF